MQIAINYGSRDEMVRGMRKMAERVLNKKELEVIKLIKLYGNELTQIAKMIDKDKKQKVVDKIMNSKDSLHLHDISKCHCSNYQQLTSTIQSTKFYQGTFLRI